MAAWNANATRIIEKYYIKKVKAFLYEVIWKKTFWEFLCRGDNVE
jgi:hypothetical protein